MTRPRAERQLPLRSIDQIHQQVVSCQRCRRLREYCTDVAAVRRRAFAQWDYWGRPVPGFGDPAARLWIIGLAPAAHGANRTGRIFTGDRSGDFLFAALHRAGLANQPLSESRTDGLALSDCYLSAAVRCAPPGNKPLPEEALACSDYLDAEWDALRHKRTILALGKIAWDASIGLCRRKGIPLKPTPPFGHGAAVIVTDSLRLIGSYHVSQQNTFTGKLTPAMFDAVLKLARKGW
jgi:uracil-DNA glycosylase family 4